MLTQDRLKELLDYNPETGEFRRKYAHGRYPVGSLIGWLDRHGHRYVMVDDVEYRGSRLAALYMTGELPPKALNHKDRNNANDAWENLTDARLPLDQARLKELLSYDPGIGKFTWIKRQKGAILGGEAGSVNPHGYVVISVDGRQYNAHRLAWLFMTGEWPKDEVDHKDLDRANNRWENLRQADRHTNCMNSPGWIKNRKSQKLKGAFLDKRDGRYFSAIRVRGKLINLGRFSTAEEAHAAYRRASEKLHGEFSRTA